MDILPDVQGGGGKFEATPVVVVGADGLPVSQGASLFSTTGALTGAGQSIELVCPNTTSGLLTVSGTFTGIIEVVGRATSGATIYGGRLLFRSGVGSVGTNRISGTGSAVANEYRVVTGGHSVAVRVVSWTSGTADIQLSAGSASPTVFVNGPVHTAEEEAVRDARSFLASLPETPVPAGQEAIFTLANPANSGRNLFLNNRLFGCDRRSNTDPIVYRAFANPTFIPNIQRPSINRRFGSPNGAAIFRYQVALEATLTPGGIEGSGEPIPVGGITRERKLQIIMPPGTSVGFSIRGVGRNIASAVNIYATLEWYEEQTN